MMGFCVLCLSVFDEGAMVVVVGEVETREKRLKGDVTVDLGEEGFEVVRNPKI